MSKNKDNLRLPLDLSTKWVNRQQPKQFMNIAGIPIFKYIAGIPIFKCWSNKYYVHLLAN